MTNEMTDNLDVTNLLEKSLEGIYNGNQIKKNLEELICNKYGVSYYIPSTLEKGG